MRNDELEPRLGDGLPNYDLGSIEPHLHAVATERQLPDLAIGLCTIRIEESGPALRAVLTKAADGEALSEDDETLLFRGLYILGAARDSRACQPLLRLLRRPDDELDSLLGDAVTESMARIVAGVFDGDADALFSFITDRSIDEFVRDAVLDAVTFLTWEGRIERDRMRNFIGRFYAEKLADDDDFAWIGWLNAIALLGLRDLAPLGHSAWDEGRVPSGVLERRHFERDLLDAEQRPDDIDRFKHANLGYIDDVLVALDWTRGFGLDEGFEPVEEDPSPWPDRTWPDRAWPDRAWPDRPDRAGSDMTPATNPWRDVGRNDPCPCGSGNKFKKCCLANWPSHGMPADEIRYGASSDETQQP